MKPDASPVPPTGSHFDLRRARFNAGLSLTALSEATGVHRETLRLIESGEGAPVLGHNPATLKRIADHFGVTVLDILDEDRDAA